MKISQLDPTVGRLMICQADLIEVKKQNDKMLMALKAIVDAQYEKGGTLASLNGTVSNARELLKDLQS